MKKYPVIVFLPLMMMALACSMFDSLRKNVSGEKPDEVEIPRNVKSADEDYKARKETACVVSLLKDGKILFSEKPVTKDELGAELKTCIEDKPPDERTIYIKSEVARDYGEIVEILNMIRKQDVDKASFIVSKKEQLGFTPEVLTVRIPSEPNPDLSPRLEPPPSPAKIPKLDKNRPPERIASVNEPTNSNLKPNPLTLIVFLSKDGKIRLNMDPRSSLEDLTTFLTQIFKDRENNGVLREGTNEVEKTVFIKAPRSIKYGEVIKAIDAVKMGGGEPVGLQIDDLEN